MLASVKRAYAYFAVPTFIVLAVAVVSLGPSGEVVCGTGAPLDRLAQTVMSGLGGGHVDGPAATLCVVPTATAWVLGALVILGGSVVIIAASRHSRPVRDETVDV
jgi:hypothetical protein